MNSVSLALKSIAARKMQSILCVLAGGAGIALLSAVILLSGALRDGLARNANGVDVVIGAKGSPLQLVLSSVYHADVPNGNIDIKDADHAEHDPRVEHFIPLALGDNHNGFRIVGTTPDYVALYHGQLANGAMFSQPFDAVAGALTNIPKGAQFAAVHGLSPDSDDVHNFHLYTITGTLKPTGTVLDRLILTSVGSVQELHKHPDIGDPDAAEELQIGHQVTALLIKVRSPIDVINLPRAINSTSNLLAADPGYEMTRLSETLGFGRTLVTALGIGFVVLSALVLLSMLAAGLAARRYDLGIMRVLGAAPERLFATVAAEGMILGGAGAFIGLIAGHVGAYVTAGDIDSLKGFILPSGLLMPTILDVQLLALGFGIGLVAAAIPGFMAARTDISSLLARGRV